MSESEIKHFNLTIRGRVQNVGFRFSCMEAAYQFGVFGFVKNQKDGSLYIEVEGLHENLERFLQWCRKGPVWAKVYEFKIEEGECQNYDSFEIVRR